MLRLLFQNWLCYLWLASFLRGGVRKRPAGHVASGSPGGSDPDIGCSSAYYGGGAHLELAANITPDMNPCNVSDTGRCGELLPSGELHGPMPIGERPCGRTRVSARPAMTPGADPPSVMRRPAASCPAPGRATHSLRESALLAPCIRNTTNCGAGCLRCAAV